MSDGVFIPGISNKYNSQSTIEKIMNKKREKLNDFNGDKKKIEEKQKNLGEVSGRVVVLDRKVRDLYGVSNPFDEKVAYSNDSNISIAVTKQADIGEYSMKVSKKAQAHRIAAKPIARDMKIVAGTYNFGSGEKTAKVKFSGGTIEDLRKVINEQAGGVIKASVTFDTSKTGVLVLESEITGDKSRISFEDQITSDVFKKLGFFEDIPGFSQTYALSSKNIISVEKIVEPNITDGKLKLYTESSFLLNLSEPVAVRSGIVLEIEMMELSKSKNEHSQVGTVPPDVPNFNRIGDKSILGIEIPGEDMVHGIDPYEKPSVKPLVVVRDDSHIELVTSKRKIELNDIDLNEIMTKKTFVASDFLNEDEMLTGIIFKNNDTEKEVFVQNINIYDRETVDGIRFSKELSKAQNADITFDGIDISRKTNSIDDLIKGVTFTILGETNGEALIQVDRNYPKMVEKIMDFLTEYNQLLDAIDKKTEIIKADEIKDSEDKESRGILSNERELKTLASKLRVILMNPYDTGEGMQLSMLSQIGISTNETGRGTNAEKLKGFLEYDEDKFIDKFIEVMEKYPQGVKNLFGKDVDKDFVYDTGIAVEMNKLFKGYLEKSTGYFDMRNQIYSNDFKRKNEEIDKYKKVLDEEELKLKDQFFKMERSAQELEDNRKKFDNFNKGN